MPAGEARRGKGEGVSNSAMKQPDGEPIRGPAPFEVIQRRGPPGAAAPDNGAGRIELAVPGLPAAAADAWELHYRPRLLGPRAVAAPPAPVGRARLAARADGCLGTALEIPAGGWYALDCALVENGSARAKQSLGPFGIGERFLIAGQSYAGNHHDALLTVDDPEGRAVAYDPAARAWRIAHDPQPSWLLAEQGVTHWQQLAQEIVRKGFVFPGGSVWPAAMNALVPELGMPLGTLSVVRSASSLADWLPGSPLFDSLAAAVRHFHPFRAILWQLGEADAGRMTASDDFIAQFTRLKQALAEATGTDPVWMLAKSTYHPAAHANAEGQQRVRAAIDRLCVSLDNVVPGPDTDQLGRDYRQVDRQSRHFTAEGQRRAGELWARAIADHLERR